MSHPDSNIHNLTQPHGAALNRGRAGAGTEGLLLFFVFTSCAALFFLADWLFPAMVSFAVAALTYKTGRQALAVLWDTARLLVYGRHIRGDADDLYKLHDELAKLSDLKARTGHLDLKGADLHNRSHLHNFVEGLLQNPSKYHPEPVRAFISTRYYLGSHEHYNYTAQVYDFIGNLMPLVGLVGTVYGLVSTFQQMGGSPSMDTLGPALSTAMLTTLYGAILAVGAKLAGSRFNQQIEVLNYDYDEVCDHLTYLLDGGSELWPAEKAAQ